jgi:hypothetical protein
MMQAFALMGLPGTLYEQHNGQGQDYSMTLRFWAVDSTIFE